jgi:hypothetical protein
MNQEIKVMILLFVFCFLAKEGFCASGNNSVIRLELNVSSNPSSGAGGNSVIGLDLEQISALASSGGNSVIAVDLEKSVKKASSAGNSVIGLDVSIGVQNQTQNDSNTNQTLCNSFGYNWLSTWGNSSGIKNCCGNDAAEYFTNSSVKGTSTSYSACCDYDSCADGNKTCYSSGDTLNIAETQYACYGSMWINNTCATNNITSDIEGITHYACCMNSSACAYKGECYNSTEYYTIDGKYYLCNNKVWSDTCTNNVYQGNSLRIMSGDTLVAVLGQSGYVSITGSIMTNCNQTSSGKIFNLSASGRTFWIDNNGDMCLPGSISQMATSIPSPSGNDFMIYSNIAQSYYIGLFDAQDLYLKKTLASKCTLR